MPIFSKEQIKLFHIHIPKTAGRYITTLFKSNSFDITYNNFDYLVEGYELPHLWYPLYENIPVQDAVHFVIVRDPVEKFKSSLKNWKDFYNLDENFLDIEDFDIDYFVKNSIENEFSSFFVPQWKFITDKTFVWKYEFGFGDEFFSWIKKNLKVDIRQPDQLEEYPRFTYDFVKTPKISSHVESMIRDYYKKDYEIFGY